MRELYEGLAMILLTTFIMALVFIFTGTPDLWDVWHNAAMIGNK